MTSLSQFKKVANLLREARALLARPETDLGSTKWANTQDALREVDDLIVLAEASEPRALFEAKFLFAPTSEFQEASFPSGWGDEYLELSARFDKAIGDL